MRIVDDPVASSSDGPAIFELREDDMDVDDAPEIPVPHAVSHMHLFFCPYSDSILCSQDTDDLRSLRRELESTKLERDELQGQVDDLEREKQALLDNRHVLEGQALEKTRELERINNERKNLAEHLKESKFKVSITLKSCTWSFELTMSSRRSRT